MKKIKHTVTDQDLENNRFIREEGIPIGGLIEIGILDDQDEYRFLKDFGEVESGGAKEGETIILPNVGWTVEDVDARIADGTLEKLDNIVVSEQKQIENQNQDINEDVVITSDYFITEDGINLPKEIEGHVIQNVIDKKNINGIIYYNCLCDDGCTYDTVAII